MGVFQLAWFLKDKDPISLKNSVAIGQIFWYKEDCWIW